MQLAIPKDVEASIQAKAAAAGFETIESYILDKLELDEAIPEFAPMSYEEWRQKFDEFVARQISRNPNFDDSRESIYPVR